MMNEDVARGSAVIESLAARFPQLYVAPSENAREDYRLASTRGIKPEGATLEHFKTSPEDELREVQTPAGTVEVAFIAERADFETLLQIISHKSQPVPIARTVGAITYRGLADWQKVETAFLDYIGQGGTDWSAEFARLAKESGAFRSEIVVISNGPYSNIDAAETPYDDDEWMRISREIRLHHECAHVVCRRMRPDDITPIWDEITADVVGLLCATQRYDAKLAARFLGVSPSGFLGGRLSEYLDEEQAPHIDSIATEVWSALLRIEETYTEDDASNPFDYLLHLKEYPFLSY